MMLATPSGFCPWRWDCRAGSRLVLTHSSPPGMWHAVSLSAKRKMAKPSPLRMGSAGARRLIPNGGRDRGIPLAPDFPAAGWEFAEPGGREPSCPSPLLLSRSRGDRPLVNDGCCGASHRARDDAGYDDCQRQMPDLFHPLLPRDFSPCSPGNRSPRGQLRQMMFSGALEVKCGKSPVVRVAGRASPWSTLRLTRSWPAY